MDTVTAPQVADRLHGTAAIGEHITLEECMGHYYEDFYLSLSSKKWDTFEDIVYSIVDICSACDWWCSKDELLETDYFECRECRGYDL